MNESFGAGQDFENDEWKKHLFIWTATSKVQEIQTSKCTNTHFYGGENNCQNVILKVTKWLKLGHQLDNNKIMGILVSGFVSY